MIETALKTEILVCVRHKRKCEVTHPAPGIQRVRHLDGITGELKELCDSQQFTQRIETILQRDEL